MEQTNLLIQDLVYIYRQKQESDTYLIGSLPIPDRIKIISTSEIDKMIMPSLVEVFPEIRDRWAITVAQMLDGSGSYLSLVRDDDPDELAAIEQTYTGTQSR